MKYVYDIVVNFNKNYFEFYEWKKNDNIINIKKMPLFLVNDNIYKILKYDKVVVSLDFINFIKDKTYTYKKNKIGIAAIVSNGMEAIGLLFNDNGNLIKRSSLLIDEEEEILNEVIDYDVYNIDIIKRENNISEDGNRFQKEKKSFLIKYINKENDITNLKYLYYDYFEREENNIDNIKSILLNEIKSNWNNKFNSFYETVKLFSKIKN